MTICQVDIPNLLIYSKSFYEPQPYFFNK